MKILFSSVLFSVYSHGKTTKANFKNSAEGDGVPEVNDSPSHQVTARECPAQCSCARGLH